MSRRDWLIVLGVALLLLLLWWFLRRKNVTSTGGTTTAWTDTNAGSAEAGGAPVTSLSNLNIRQTLI